MIKFIKKFIFLFNTIAIGLLLITYASVFVNPGEYWFFSLLGLAYPFILIINITFVVLWIIQVNHRFIYSLMAIVIGFSFLSRTIKLNNKVEVSDTSINIISYNAGLFGYYQSKWNVQETIDAIAKIDPDVVCIQEFLNLKKDSASTIDTISKALKMRYYHFEKLKDGRKRGEYGMAILSKYPLLKSELVQFDGLTGNMSVYSDLKIDKRVFRVYNVHLQSFKFRKNDYKFVENLNTKEIKDKIEPSKNILRKIKQAYNKRAHQVDTLSAHFSQCQYPYFVIGDFNDPPVSYTYQKLSQNLNDAFVEKGIGLGKTYIGVMPNFRIDYILFPKEWSINEYRSYRLSSDHKLLIAKFKDKIN